jgi:hypothetical protein
MLLAHNAFSVGAIGDRTMKWLSRLWQTALFFGMLVALLWIIPIMWLVESVEDWERDDAKPEQD